MIPYDAKEPCAKCGNASNDIHVVFFKSVLDDEDEYIRVICVRCEHAWRRGPLDKKVEA